MTDSRYPTDSQELRREFETVIRGAHENGVDVEGSYELRFGDALPDYEVVLLEVSKPSASETDD